MREIKLHKYDVKLVNNFEDFEGAKVTCFSCIGDGNLRTMIAAYAAFYSGDPIECFVNGEKASLEKDYGLLEK